VISDLASGALPVMLVLHQEPWTVTLNLGDVILDIALGALDCDIRPSIKSPGLGYCTFHQVPWP
jgi:hypothetical protein